MVSCASPSRSRGLESLGLHRRLLEDLRRRPGDQDQDVPRGRLPGERGRRPLALQRAAVPNRLYVSLNYAKTAARTTAKGNSNDVDNNDNDSNDNSSLQR